MCHQTIFSFNKCQHTARALTVCHYGILVPLRPCLGPCEGDFIHFDSLCKGCQAVFRLQGETNGQCLPRRVQGIHDSMPFEYVVEAQLPWKQRPRSDTQKQHPSAANMVVWSEWDDWQTWEEQLLSLLCSERDTIMERNEPLRRKHALPYSPPPPPPPAAAEAPVGSKSSIKRTDGKKTCSAEPAAAESRPRCRVRFLPTAEVRYYTEDTAASLIRNSRDPTTLDMSWIT